MSRGATRLPDGLLERTGERAGHADLTTGFAALLPVGISRRLLPGLTPDGTPDHRPSTVSRALSSLPVARTPAGAPSVG